MEEGEEGEDEPGTADKVSKGRTRKSRRLRLTPTTIVVVAVVVVAMMMAMVVVVMRRRVEAEEESAVRARYNG